MSRIGYLTPTGPGDFWSDLRGQVRTLNFRGDLRIAALGEQNTNPGAPSHRVLMRDPDGEQMELGSAWAKTLNRGDQAGETFLSVMLDDPSFPHPLNFAVFRDGEKAVATWRRRQEQSS